MRRISVGVLLVVALAGCGGGGSASGNGEASKPARRILADAAKAAGKASSVHMSGSITEKGQRVAVDLTFEKRKGATGSITLHGQKIDLVVVGHTGYMRAAAAFWMQFGHNAAGPALARLLGGKWLKFQTSDPRLGPIASIAASRLLFRELAKIPGKVAKRGTTTYDGRNVVAIHSSSQAGTIYIAATGTAYPVAIAMQRAGTVVLGGWNEPVALSAPAGAIDLSHVKALAG